MAPSGWAAFTAATMMPGVLASSAALRWSISSTTALGCEPLAHGFGLKATPKPDSIVLVSCNLGCMAVTCMAVTCSVPIQCSISQIMADAAHCQKRMPLQEEEEDSSSHHLSSQLRADQMPGLPREDQLMCTHSKHASMN